MLNQKNAFCLNDSCAESIFQQKLLEQLKLIKVFVISSHKRQTPTQTNQHSQMRE
jgi:hypothetical protein